MAFVVRVFRFATLYCKDFSFFSPFPITFGFNIYSLCRFFFKVDYLKWMTSDGACRFVTRPCNVGKADTNSELGVRVQKAIPG